MALSSFKELVVWQKSMSLVKEIYRTTGELPKAEEYNLASQMRRSVISTPSNIAEGYKRSGTGEYVRFLNIAETSAAELETQLLLEKELYPVVVVAGADKCTTEVQKMLFGMIKKLKARSVSITKP